jgi:hypothetical protein
LISEKAAAASDISGMAWQRCEKDRKRETMGE